MRILRERYHRIVQEGRAAENEQSQRGQAEVLPNKPKSFPYGVWLSTAVRQKHQQGFEKLMSDIQRDIDIFQRRGETTNAQELMEIRNRYKGKLRRTRRR